MSPVGQRPPRTVQAPTPQPDGAAETGSVTTMVVIFAAALVLVTGLVSDGGMTLVAKRRAINIAEQAARAGAQEVSIAAVRGGGGPYRLDPRRPAPPRSAPLVAPATAAAHASTATPSRWRSAGRSR